MKKTIAALSMAICTISTALAQKEANYLKMYYKDSKTVTNQLIIAIDDAVSTAGGTKFKLKITNKTNDYVVYKPEESKFIIGGKELNPTEKWLIIPPNESDYKIINLKGTEYNTVKNYSFFIDGLYKVSLGNSSATPDFKLPVSQNDFKTGNFNCSLIKLTKETGKTEVKFKCTYTGDKLGFIFPSKTIVKMPDGNEYASKVSSGLFSKQGPVVLLKGTDEDFTVRWDRMQGGKTMDMQKVEMLIKWNDAFIEGTPEKMKPETVEIQFDEAKSNEKGKAK